MGQKRVGSQGLPESWCSCQARQRAGTRALLGEDSVLCLVTAAQLGVHGELGTQGLSEHLVMVGLQWVVQVRAGLRGRIPLVLRAGAASLQIPGYCFAEDFIPLLFAGDRRDLGRRAEG